MPLVAIYNGMRIEAHRASNEKWVELKSKYTEESLVFPCGQGAVPSTKSNGTKYFAHRSGTACPPREGGVETADHLNAKAMIADAASRLGWDSTIEFVGPKGEWVADVHAAKGGRRIALEVQWSAQSSADFNRRQKRYTDAGLECFWFISQKNVQAAVEADVPFASFFSDDYRRVEMAPLHARGARYPDLRRAVKHVLSSEYRQRFQGTIERLAVAHRRAACGTCLMTSTLFTVTAVSVRTPCGDHTTYYRTPPRWVGYEDPSDGQVELAVFEEVRLAVSKMSGARVAVLGANKGASLIFACPHCDGRLAEIHRLRTSEWAQGVVEVDSALKLSPSLEDIPHLCIDIGQGHCRQMPDWEASSIWWHPLFHLGIWRGKKSKKRR